MASSSSALYFQLHQTAEAYVRSFHREKIAGDITAASRALSPTCKHYIGPPSMGEKMRIPQSPTCNKAIEDQLGGIFKYIDPERLCLEIKDITVDEIQRKAVVHAVYNVAMKANYGSDTCKLETIVTLWIAEGGKLIDKVHQFLDSLVATTFYSDNQWVCRRPESIDPG